MIKFISISVLIISSAIAHAQKKLNLNVFGDILYEYNYFPNTPSTQNELGSFKLGEQDFFLTGNLSDKISYLGEVIIKGSASSSSGFDVSVERVRIKYNYYKNHSLLVGKMHSAVNYWNDVYHHGRIFFPTIDRPLNFSYFLPIHSMGIRMQGQNLGKYKFGYDFMVSNGMESTDFSSNGLNYAYIASVHIKPVKGMRLMLGYNWDRLPTNSHGPHAHSGTYHNHSFTEEVKLNQFYFSFARFRKSFEILNEFALIHSETDSLGVSLNYSNYTYLGYRIKHRYVPYFMFDFMQISKTELHTVRLNTMKYALGFKWDINPMLNLKVQLERYAGIPWASEVPDYNEKYELKIQLSYAL